jgi:hypothetical protein
MDGHDHEKPTPPDHQQKDDDKPQQADKTNEPKATPDSAKLCSFLIFNFRQLNVGGFPN